MRRRRNFTSTTARRIALKINKLCLGDMYCGYAGFNTYTGDCVLVRDEEAKTKNGGVPDDTIDFLYVPIVFTTFEICEDYVNDYLKKFGAK